MYEPGDEHYWAYIESSIEDFKTYDLALEYFKKTYLHEPYELKRRCVFVMNHKNEAVATCTAWYDFLNSKKIPSLHWLATLPKYEGLGIGKAVCHKVLEIFEENNELPIYLHTQPWSYKAIYIYSTFEFYL